MKMTSNAVAIITACVLLTKVWLAPAEAATLETGVIFLNPLGASVASQDEILSKMKAAGVHLIRTAITDDPRHLEFAKLAYQHGIEIDALLEPQFYPGTKLRANPPQAPLSMADPELSQAYFESLLGHLDSEGVVLAGLELGNEINWSDFNGDFSMPGEGKIFGAAGLINDPEGQHVAAGFIQYIKILAALRAARDQSTLNHKTPIISAGLANNGAARTLNSKADGVSINATLLFLRAHGMDKVVDFYGIHFYPWNNAPASRKTNLYNNAVAECEPQGSTTGKSCWITEWGVKNGDAGCPFDEGARPAIVRETMINFETLAQQGRLQAAYYYTWNSNPASKQLDPMSIFRCGSLTQAGKLAITP